MAYYKKFIIILLLLFVILFNFSICFASEVEDVDVSVVSGVVLNHQGNYFIASERGSTGYFPIEKGYIYTLENISDSENFIFAFSDEIPTLNGVYYDRNVLTHGSTYTFISSDKNYLYFDYSWYNSNVLITREKIAGQESAISDLVENVGPNALWGVFGSGIDFVFVIVIVAFGLFIIFKLIKGLSKGKSKI